MKYFFNIFVASCRGARRHVVTIIFGELHISTMPSTWIHTYILLKYTNDKHQQLPIVINLMTHNYEEMGLDTMVINKIKKLFCRSTI